MSPAGPFYNAPPIGPRCEVAATTGILVAAGVALILDCAWVFVVSFVLWRDPELALQRESYT